MSSKERLCVVCGSWIPEAQPLIDEGQGPMHEACAAATADDYPTTTEGVTP